MSRIETAVMESRMRWPDLGRMRKPSRMREHRDALAARVLALKTKCAQLRDEASAIDREVATLENRWEAVTAKMRAAEFRLMGSLCHTAGAKNV